MSKHAPRLPVVSPIPNSSPAVRTSPKKAKLSASRRRVAKRRSTPSSAPGAGRGSRPNKMLPLALAPTPNSDGGSRGALGGGAATAAGDGGGGGASGAGGGAGGASAGAATVAPSGM